MDREPFDKLKKKFEAAARRHAFFPVYVVTDDDGPSIAVGSHVSRYARQRLEELAKDALPLLRQYCDDRSIKLDHPSTASLAGQWLFWVAFRMNALPRGSWLHRPVDAGNTEEFRELTSNAFALSAVAVDSLWCESAKREATGLTIDGEAAAIALLPILGSNVTKIAEALHVSRTLLYSWPKFREALTAQQQLEGTNAAKVPAGDVQKDAAAAWPLRPIGGYQKHRTGRKSPQRHADMESTPTRESKQQVRNLRRRKRSIVVQDENREVEQQYYKSPKRK